MAISIANYYTIRIILYFYFFCNSYFKNFFRFFAKNTEYFFVYIDKHGRLWYTKIVRKPFETLIFERKKII